MLERVLTPSADIGFLTAHRPMRTLAELKNISGAPSMCALLYNKMRRTRRIDAKVIVFCDVERIGPEQEDRAAKLASAWSKLDGAPLLLNSPPRALRRYPLMKALKHAGINQSDVARLDDPEGLGRIRYPCFIRYENGHIDKGIKPDLLNNADEMATYLAEMRADGRTTYGKIAIEFEDLRDEHGDYIKYAYFRVGDRLVAGHRFVNSHWFVKSASPELLARRPEAIEAEREFVETAPYQEQIARVFDIAGIQYGRIDFGVRKDGGLHIFEINTNPRHPKIADTYPARREIIGSVKANLAGAFAALTNGRSRKSLSWRRGVM
jgi:hypothetical protein